MDTIDKFTRSRALFGEDFAKIQNANVLVCGCGGVGGLCIDALCRAGVGKITIIDDDKFDITNQNRQLYSQNLGENKVEVFAKIYPQITPICMRLSPENIAQMDFEGFDVIIDAIDDTKSKIALALKTHAKLISSFGAAKRIDPTKIKVANVWQTHDDALARKIRTELKKANFKGKYLCVFSDEASRCKDLGSFMGVSGAFGLILSSLAVRKILGEI